jgi:tetratricopeptide (TPR) repeat protein
MKAFRVLVRAHVNLAQFAEAERVYRESQETYPRVQGLADAEMACILHEMSHAKCLQHDPGEAEGLARRAMELHRRVHGMDGLETGFCWRILGDALAMQGKHAEAESSFRNALSIFRKQLDPGGRSIRIAVDQLVHSLRHQKKLDEAVAVHREAIEVAVASCNKALAIDPQSAPAHNGLAWLLATVPDAKFRDSHRSIELAQKAVELAPKEGSYWNTLGVAHYRAGDWKAAIAAFKKSMALRQGGDSFDWFFLAMAHWQLGDKDEARRWHDRAVEWMKKKDPTNEELIRFRAEAAELLSVEKNEGLRRGVKSEPEIN